MFSVFFFPFPFQKRGQKWLFKRRAISLLFKWSKLFVFIGIDKSCSFAPASRLSINHLLTQVLLYLLLFTFVWPAFPSQLQTHFTLESRIFTWCLVWHFVAPCSFHLFMISSQLAFVCWSSPVPHWMNRKASESHRNVLWMSVHSHQTKKKSYCHWKMLL